MFFVIVFVVSFVTLFGVSPGFSLPVFGMVGLWLIFSYVIALYCGYDLFASFRVLGGVIRAAFALLLSVGVSLSYFWITSAIFGPNDSRGFLIPLLFLFASLSCFLQAALFKMIRAIDPQSLKWVLIGSSQLLANLRRYLIWKRLHAEIFVFFRRIG